MNSPMCFCGSNSHLDTNAKIYGKEYGNGKIWLCDRFPDCRGSVGTHPDGSPLGTIPSPEVKQLRMKLHGLIDPHWRGLRGKAKKRKRGALYGYLSDITGVPREHAHIGEFDEWLCDHAIKQWQSAPYVAMSKHNKENYDESN